MPRGVRKNARLRWPLHEAARRYESDEVVDGVVLDYGASGALVGIDVQHASEKADIHRLSLSTCRSLGCKPPEVSRQKLLF